MKIEEIVVICPDAKVFDFDDALPYKSNNFDIVIASDILQYSKSPDASIREWLRVGKKLIIYFPNFGFWFYRLELLLGHFPSLALYGHEWWETRQTKFFTFSDFLKLPAMNKITVTRLAGIDWKNRGVSYLAIKLPNIFARSVIIEIKK